MDLKKDEIINRIASDLMGKIYPIGKEGSRLIDRSRSDTIAWSAIALSVIAGCDEFVQNARETLFAIQLQDGRVPLRRETPPACWVTPVAVIAWHGAEKYKQAQTKAIDFLISFSGVHWENTNRNILGHDTSIRGWPWIEHTHSFVEPTALVIIALEITRKINHPRAQEAIAMLLNRQLQPGGWNYGNTTVFGSQLRPMPESTGLALTALAGKVDKITVAGSIDYLQDVVGRLKTPVSLCWSLIGLDAWGKGPENKLCLIDRCLAQQEIYGPYNCFQLSLLLIATLSETGFVGVVPENTITA